MWVWVRVSTATLERAINALRESLTRKHSIASHTPNKSLEQRLRDEADADHVAAEELKRARSDDTGEWRNGG